MSKNQNKNCKAEIQPSQCRRILIFYVLCPHHWKSVLLLVNGLADILFKPILREAAEPLSVGALCSHCPWQNKPALLKMSGLEADAKDLQQFSSGGIPWRAEMVVRGLSEHRGGGMLILRGIVYYTEVSRCVCHCRYSCCSVTRAHPAAMSNGKQQRDVRPPQFLPSESSWGWSGHWAASLALGTLQWPHFIQFLFTASCDTLDDKVIFPPGFSGFFAKLQIRV